MCEECPAMVNHNAEDMQEVNDLYADWRGDRITDAEYREGLEALGYGKTISGGYPIKKKD